MELTETPDAAIAERPLVHPAVETAWFDHDDGLSAVLFDERVSMLHRINGAAAVVWSMCDGETTVPGMIDEIAEAFGVATEHVAADIENVVADFWAKGLLVDSPEPIRVVMADQHAHVDHETGEAVLPGASDP